MGEKKSLVKAEVEVNADQLEEVASKISRVKSVKFYGKISAGAAAGAYLESPLMPPVGTIVGAAIGGGLGAFKAVRDNKKEDQR